MIDNSDLNNAHSTVQYTGNNVYSKYSSFYVSEIHQYVS